MATLQQLERKIKKIEDRNRKVEVNKAWELSWTRRIIIFLITYIVIVIYFYAAKLPSPWLNSIVPALAFMLSTATVPIAKKLWSRDR